VYKEETKGNSNLEAAASTLKVESFKQAAPNSKKQTAESKQEYALGSCRVLLVTKAPYISFQLHVRWLSLMMIFLDIEARSKPRKL
jgi:hypothetical protein